MLKKGDSGLKVHEWLAAANDGKLSQAELFPRLARHFPKMITAFQKSTIPGQLPQPLMVRGSTQGSKRLVLFTDMESAQAIQVQNKASLVFSEKDVLTLLQRNFREGLDGIVINPGTTPFVIDRKYMFLLLCEYALIHLKGIGGAWIPSKGNDLLMIDLGDGFYTVPVYLSEEDAQEICIQSKGGKPRVHPWHRIRDRCWELGAEAPFLQYGFPEQVILFEKHLNELCGDDRRSPLGSLEKAVIEGQGIANSWGICQALAKVGHIWIVSDKNGKMVPLSQNESFTVDLFTSKEHALSLIEKVRQERTDLPELSPLLIRAEPFFRALEPRRPIVCINRESADSWISIVDDTLSHVMKLSDNTSMGNEGE